MFGNDEADKGAKEGVEEHPVPAMVVEEWKEMEKETKRRAMWIGKATTLANNLPEFPFKDSEVARWKAEKGRKGKAARKAAKERKKPWRFTEEEGGHMLVKVAQASGIRSG